MSIPGNELSAHIENAKTAAAHQMAFMAVARHFRPEIQDLCRQLRMQPFPGRRPAQESFDAATAKSSLFDRMRKLVDEGGPVVDSERDGVSYRYAVPASGTAPLPDDVRRAMEAKVELLEASKLGYTEAARSLEAAKLELYANSAKRSPQDRHLRFADATTVYHANRVGYHEQIRRYLSERASLALNGFDLRKIDARAQLGRIFDPFMRDCESVLRQSSSIKGPQQSPRPS